MASLFVAWLITFLVSVFAIVYVVILGKKGWLSPLLARKIMHLGTGPAYLLCWCLFPDSVLSPYLAASVIFIVTSVFVAAGSETVRLDDLVAVVSRTGRRSELLGGPLLYGLAHVLGTLMFWRHSPTGVVSIMILCFGDGVADMFGRKFGGGNPLPWNPGKSCAGSLGFWVAAYLGCMLMGYVYFHTGFWDEHFRSGFGSKCALVVSVAALVESLPIESIDNILIFIACATTGFLIW